MQYEPEFYPSFIRRTHEIVNEYDGKYDATLLINCLLGLLVLPQQRMFENIEDIPFESLEDFGISEQSFPSICYLPKSQRVYPSFRLLLRKLRNSVAHMRILPLGNAGEVRGFEFNDLDGFKCHLNLHQIRKITILINEKLG